MVSFSQIPSDTRVPGAYIEFDSSRAQRGLPGMPHKAIIIGQRLAAGQVAALAPTLITNAETAASAFGRGSMLHAMASAFLTPNDATELWAIALDDDGAGVKAVKSATFSKVDGGEDFGSGIVNLWIGGRRIRVSVSDDTTPAEIVTALVAAATDPTLPAVLTADGGTPEKLLVTARHAGATGNDIDVRLNYYSDERSPANLAVVFATDTAGAGDPEIDTALAAIDGDWWTEPVMPYLDGANYAHLHDFLKDRFDARDMRDGVGFTARGGNLRRRPYLGQWGQLPAHHHDPGSRFSDPALGDRGRLCRCCRVPDPDRSRAPASHTRVARCPARQVRGSGHAL